MGSQWTLQPMIAGPGGLTGSDLGTRLRCALSQLQDEGCGPVIFIGSDTPDLPNTAIKYALDTVVEDPDKAVLNPADDGGYVLLGLPANAPLTVFDDVKWSHEDTLLTQTKALEQAGFSVMQGDVFCDVDEFSDLVALRDRLPSHVCPRIGRWLREMVGTGSIII